MLNQLKSKQINLIKYSVIVPIMVVFLVFFNTKTVAQVKESNTSKKDYQAFISEIKIEVDMNTTDEALEEHSAFVKEKVEVYLKFNKIKRNKKGEIIAINSTYKSNNGSSGNYKVTNNKPIEPFVLTIDINKDGTTKTLGFSSEKKEQENSIILIGKKDEEVTKLIGNTSSSSQTSNNTITEKVKSDNIKIKYKFKNYNDPNTVEQIELPASSQNYSWFTNEDNSKPLVFIDGKESNIDFNLNSIKPEDIAHINILKGEGATFVYGEKAKNGVIEITLKEYPSQLKTNKEPLYIVDNKEVISLEHIGKDDIESMFVVTDKEKRDSYGEKAKNGVVLVTLKKEKLHDDKNPVPLFVVDGKIVDTIENLKKKNIKSLTVLKNEAAVSKYGEEGKNGVIEIITKKN